MAQLPSTASLPRHLWRCARRKLPVQQISGTRTCHRPQRFRRSTSRPLGMGSTKAGCEHLGGRSAERSHRSSMRTATTSCVSAYRLPTRTSERPLFDRSFNQVDLNGLTDHVTRSWVAGRIRRAASTAGGVRVTMRCRGSPSRITDELVENPPLRYTTHAAGHRLPPGGSGRVCSKPLARAWRRVVSGYNVIDVAHRVVGVGCVALRAYVALCEGRHPGRRHLLAAQAGSPIRSRALPVRRLGLARPPRTTRQRNTSKLSRRSVIHCSGGAPWTTASTTSVSSGT